MNNKQAPEFQRWIHDVLSRLSWDAAQQVEYVRSLHVGVDEIALEFDDALNLAQAKMRDGLLDSAAYQALLPIDDQLELMTERGAELWDEKALSTAVEWQELRILASRAQIFFSS